MSGGMARMIASAENITMTAMKAMEKITALGRLRRGCWTSSAIDPALSKPTKDQPTKAMVVRNGPEMLRKPAVPKPSVSTETELSRWKSSSHPPSPMDPTISARMLPVIRIFSTSRPEMLAAVPSRRITQATNAC